MKFVTPSTRPIDLGVAVFGERDRLASEMAGAILDSAAELGVRGRLVTAPDALGELTFLIGINRPGGLAELLAASRTPHRLIWFGEPLPPAVEVREGTHSPVRSRVFSLGRQVVSAFPRGRARTAVSRLGGRMADLEPWDNLRAAVRLAGLAEFVVTSRDGAQILSAAGVQSRTVPFGYTPKLHGPLTLEGPRDIETLVLGGFSGPRSRRRRRIVEALRRGGLSVTLADGVWGEERNLLLRRSRVVLQVHRFPGTFIGSRLLLAIAAGAVVVTEPMTDPYPFLPDVHFIQAPLESLLAETRALLADEDRRRRIALAGQELLAGDLSMTRCLNQVLDRLDVQRAGAIV